MNSDDQPHRSARRHFRVIDGVWRLVHDEPDGRKFVFDDGKLGYDTWFILRDKPMAFITHSLLASVIL